MKILLAAVAIRRSCLVDRNGSRETVLCQMLRTCNGRIERLDLLSPILYVVHALVVVEHAAAIKIWIEVVRETRLALTSRAKLVVETDG